MKRLIVNLFFLILKFWKERISKTVKAAKADKSLQKELDILEKIKEALENGKCARTVELDSPEDKAFVDSLTLLTAKPVLYAANVCEDDIADDAVNNDFVNKVREFAKNEGSEVFVLCAKIEEEIAELEEDEKKEFLADFRYNADGLDRLIAASYKLGTY